jgi:hypothetical protein
MEDNSKSQQNIEEVRDLLSPYLDGEVTAAEREQVEAALADWPELRDDLESLRQTVSLLSALPAMAAPRPFTLADADVQPVAAPQPKRRSWLSGWLGGLAAAAVALMCVLAAGGLFFGGQLMNGSGGAPAEIAMQQDMAAPSAAEAELAAEVPAEAPGAETEQEANFAEAPPAPAEAMAESAAMADEAVEEAEQESPAVAPDQPAAAEMAGAAETIEEEQTVAPETDADDTAAGEALMAESAKVAPAQEGAAAPPAESRSAADSEADGATLAAVPELAEMGTPAAQPEADQVPVLEPTTTPSSQATAAAQATPTASPMVQPVNTPIQTLEPTIPVREVQEPQLIFTVLNLAGILLFSVLVLGGIAIMIFGRGKKP